MSRYLASVFVRLLIYLAYTSFVSFVAYVTLGKLMPAKVIAQIYTFSLPTTPNILDILGVCKFPSYWPVQRSVNPFPAFSIDLAQFNLNQLQF